MGSLDDSQSGAEELLGQAVAEDPNFASAYIHLAHAIHNQGRPLEDYRPHLESALRLADTTTERERYFIRGSYYQLLGQREKAIAAYDALLKLYPDHPWGTGNLVHLYDESNPKDIERIVLLEQREADARPADFELNWNAGHNFVVYSRDPGRAEPYLRRARVLLTPADVQDSPYAASWLELQPFTESWINGDIETAARELDRVSGKIDSLTGGAKRMFAVKAAMGYLTLGKIQAARRISDKIFEPLTRNDTLAQISYLQGDVSALMRQLQVPGNRKLSYLSPGWWQTLAILQARAGLFRQARSFLQAEERAEKNSGRRFGALETVRGELALARGDLETAIRELEEGTTLTPEWWRWPGYYLGSESLAAALAKKGELARAISVLERASEGRFQAVINNSAGGAYWLRDRLALARRYRDVGRQDDAKAVEADLRKLLALADEGHPIVVELQRRKT
jgi:tetratricopeptide (TPR) repeat protein